MMPRVASAVDESQKLITTDEAPETRPLVWALEERFEEPRILQRRDVIYLSGWCFHPDSSIRRLEVVVGGESHPVHQLGLPRPEVLHDQVRAGLDPAGHSFLSGFWVTVPVACAESRHRVAFGLRATLSDGRVVTAPVGELDLIAADPRRPSSPGDPLVAVCMATYNPPLDLLEEQMGSLLGQTHRNWICIINDDRSAPSLFAGIERLAARDPRFRVERNHRRLGYYRNFERCLARVPPEATHVAFCDQDDLWYPDKLSESLAAFEPGVTLAYCDMHIVDRAGKRIADSYWTARRNNYTDLSTLIFANTVTGAASLFRAELLDLALPFPDPVGDAFHDHWVACTALATGRIAYVDRALYAYRQHGGNVIGHYSGEPQRPFFSRMLGRLRSLPILKQRLRGRLRIAQHGYRILTRTVLFARTLEVRLASTVPERKRVAIERLASMERSFWPLLGEAIRARFYSRPTLGMEWLCLQGALGTKVARAYYRLKQSRIRAQAVVNIRTAPPSVAPTLAASYDGAEFLERKTAPLKLSVSRRAPRRVNVIVSTIDFRYLFAGYFSMFNLALRLARDGQKARLVIVDECEYDPLDWRERMADYPGLETLFDVVETSYHFDRSSPLEVSPEDGFVATSWWTAHMAHRAARDLGRERFVFFVQEFEPLFYPAGSLFSMALEAYAFPHYAVFSTEMLRDYFRRERLGVFRDAPLSGESDSIAIANAVPAFVLDPQGIHGRTRRKLAFYARPEAHAARNMFEVGLLALRKAVAQGLLDPREWQFVGMGGSGSETLDLGRGACLRLVPRTGLKEYVRELPGYDLGLSLMLSPHPSMTPLDMAAAGLVTVTNTYATKTRERLAAISPNMVPVEPTVDAIVVGLAQGAARVDRVEERLAGARLDWSMTWDETFNSDVMDRIRGFVQASASGRAPGEVAAPEPLGPDSPLPMPPLELLTHAGAGSPQDYEAVGQEFLGHFVKLGRLTPDYRVLDIGCGPGRMASPLTRFLRDGSYDGFDVDARCVAWCTAEISKRFPHFRFHHSDVRNDRYNPDGVAEASDYRFPFESGVFDLVFLGSVFTHLLPRDMNHYLEEIARVLKPGGRCIATMLLMTPEAKEGIRDGRSAFPITHDLGVYHVADVERPESTLGYEESYVVASFERVSLTVEQPVNYGRWCGRRTGLSFHDIVVAVKE